MYGEADWAKIAGRIMSRNRRNLPHPSRDSWLLVPWGLEVHVEWTGDELKTQRNKYQNIFFRLFDFIILLFFLITSFLFIYYITLYIFKIKQKQQT